MWLSPPPLLGDPEGNTRLEGEAVPAPAQPQGTSSDFHLQCGKGTAPAHCGHFLRALQRSGPSKARPGLLGIHLHQPVQLQELEGDRPAAPQHFVVPVTLPYLSQSIPDPHGDTQAAALPNRQENYGQSTDNQEHTSKEQLPYLLVPLQELPKGSPAAAGFSLPRMRSYLD